MWLRWPAWSLPLGIGLGGTCAAIALEGHPAAIAGGAGLVVGASWLARAHANSLTRVARLTDRLRETDSQLRELQERRALVECIASDTFWGMRPLDVARVALRHLGGAFPSFRVCFATVHADELRVLDSREPSGTISLVGRRMRIPTSWREELGQTDLVESPDVLSDRRWRKLRPALRRAGLRAVLSVPLRVDAGTTALLSLDTGVCHGWCDHERQSLQEAGAALARALGDANRAAEIRHARLHDPLTGLPNRDLFRDRLSHALARARRDPKNRFSVLFLDFDGFKVINESLGHAAGDELLIALSRELRESVRATDSATHGLTMSARLGGDEFVVLLENAGEAHEVDRVVSRLQRGLVRPYTIDGHEVRVTASIGVVLASGEYESTEAILRDADTAMYRAKSAGKGGHVFFQSAMHELAMQRLNLEHALRRAVAEREFTVAYQPIVRLSDEAIVGFEALLRWTDADRGQVPPSEFIPLAEEIGVISEIGDRVLMDALMQLRCWRDRHPRSTGLTMSVNVSPRQLVGDALVQSVRRALAEARLQPEALRIEVTESLVMEDPENADRVLRELVDLGVNISIDDFGTGHSSLAALERYPFDVLKIDRTFVERLESSPEQAMILDTIVTLAHRLGMTVVAEGVEKASQASALAEMECDLVQGYHYSRPLQVHDAEAFLARRC